MKGISVSEGWYSKSDLFVQKSITNEALLSILSSVCFNEIVLFKISMALFLHTSKTNKPAKFEGNLLSGLEENTVTI